MYRVKNIQVLETVQRQKIDLMVRMESSIREKQPIKRELHTGIQFWENLNVKI